MLLGALLLVAGACAVPPLEQTGPTLFLPSDAGAVVADPLGTAPVSFTVSAVDAGSGPRPVTCSRASGSSFPVGTTSVTCSAVDGQGKQANGSFEVAVTVAPNSSPPVVADVGDRHACALQVAGTVACWGENADGQLGNGTTRDASGPTAVIGLGDVVDVAAGTGRTCAVRNDGTLWCWGAGATRALQDPSVTDATAVSLAGEGNVGRCVVRGNGTVACGSTSLSAVPGISDAVDVTVGDDHACAVLASGPVLCWGTDRSGVLGNGPAGSSSVPGPVVGITNATKVTSASGGAHACALLADGSATCWGANGSGQLGDGTRMEQQTPVPVAGLDALVDIDAGAGHTCATRADGTATCWGAGTGGRLGSRSELNSATPVPVLGLADAVRVGAGSFSTCAVLDDGSARCWGDNTAGQLGAGRQARASALVPVSGLTDAIDVAAGSAPGSDGYGVRCAVRAAGSVGCWGGSAAEIWQPYTAVGRLGSSALWAATPIDVSGLVDATDVSIGLKHACAVRSTGSVVCWGSNDRGELGRDPIGNGVDFGSPTPTGVGGITDAVAIDAGWRSTCALRAGGSVACWGDNADQQLGSGSTVQWSSVPLPVLGVTDATSVTVGEDHACALRATGQVRCWGSNSHGQVGNNSIEDANGSVAVSGIGDAVRIGTGRQYTCALRSTGHVACWGRGGEGRTGLGSDWQTWVPARVVGIDDATDLAVGDDSACVRRANGTISCWGLNIGQYGAVNAPWSFAPAASPVLSGPGTLALDNSGACIRRPDGTVDCLGAEPGDVGRSRSYEPAPVAF